MSKVILKAENVYKSFGLTKAVQNFSLEIAEGEVHGLIGENGSGKSTFSSMVAGVQTMDAGQLFIDGEPYAPKNAIDASERGVSLVVQEIGTIGTISVAANIFINKEKQFRKGGMIDYKTMYAEAKKILKRIGGEHLDPAAICASLNLEDRKLVEIAKAMYSNPRLLIIDETSNALATHGREVLYQNIRAVKESGGSVLFITHDMEELIEVCDSVTIMRDGVYVDTLRGDEMVAKRLKELMVGREIADNYYRPDFEPKYDADTVVFRATDICAPNAAHVSFELHKGEILGLGGLADCGMHEVGRILFGLDRKDSGRVELADGTEIKTPVQAIKLGVGYLSKNRDTEAVILNYSIGDNIVMPSLPDLRKGPFVPKRAEREMADDWVDQLEIKCNGSKQYVKELSGGNKQKVVLAKWLAKDSQILIMDCPTRGIDIGVKEIIYQLMMSLKEQGKSIIMISEEMPELIGMSDRILVMKDYKINKEILRSPEVNEQEVVQYMV